MNETHDRYILGDPELAITIGGMIFSNIGEKKELSEEEVNVLGILDRIYKEAFLGDPSSAKQRFLDAIERGNEIVHQQYHGRKIECWPTGCFRAINGLGAAVLRHSSLPPGLWMARLGTQLTTATWNAKKMSMHQIVWSLLKFLIDFRLGDSIVSCIGAEAIQESSAIERAQTSSNVESWLTGFVDIFQFINAQRVIFISLINLLECRAISPSSLPKDLDEPRCRSEVNRIEEQFAYTIETLTAYNMFPDRASRYVQEIAELAKAQGKSAAQRRVRFDYVRLLIPKFLLNDAIRVLAEV